MHRRRFVAGRMDSSFRNESPEVVPDQVGGLSGSLHTMRCVDDSRPLGEDIRQPACGVPQRCTVCSSKRIFRRTAQQVKLPGRTRRPGANASEGESQCTAGCNDGRRRCQAWRRGPRPTIVVAAAVPRTSCDASAFPLNDKCQEASVPYTRIAGLVDLQGSGARLGYLVPDTSCAVRGSAGLILG